MRWVIRGMLSRLTGIQRRSRGGASSIAHISGRYRDECVEHREDWRKHRGECAEHREDQWEYCGESSRIRLRNPVDMLAMSSRVEASAGADMSVCAAT